MVRGFLPPEGPQNVHRTPYKYNEGQGAHRLSRAVIHSPEEIILTGVESAQNELESLGLEEVPQEVAEDCLEVYQAEDPDRTIQDILDDWRDSQEDQDGETEEDTDTESEDSSLPDIPEDLESLDYREELLPLAQAYGVVETADSRSTEDLITALQEVRDE